MVHGPSDRSGPTGKLPMDIPILIICGLLVVTLAAFFTGIFPYPYGLIVLVAALAARIFVIRGRRP
jgi:dihydroxy-acid dehydratase